MDKRTQTQSTANDTTIGTTTKRSARTLRTKAPIAVVLAVLAFASPILAQPKIVLSDPAANVSQVTHVGADGAPIPTLHVGGFRVSGGTYLFTDEADSIGVAISNLQVERLPNSIGHQLLVKIEGDFQNTVTGIGAGDIATDAPQVLQAPMPMQAFHAHYNTNILMGQYGPLPADGVPYETATASVNGANQLQATVEVSLALPGEEMEIDLAAVTVVAQPVQIGDVNLDSTVNIADAVMILFYLYPPNGSEPVELPCDAAADVNQDGSLNIGDAIRILGVVFGQGEPLELPFLPLHQGQGCGTGALQMGGQ